MDPISATSAARFVPLSVAVARDADLGPVGHVVETGSTNADLVDAARAGEAGPCVLVADHQTAGRGRLDRRWDDDPGAALLVSIRVPTTAADAPAAVRALGAAARAALDAACPVDVLAKWPNDVVVVDGPAAGKLAGVLAELVDSPEPCVVIGIGVNLAPISRQEGATSVIECGGDGDRDTLLAAVLSEFAARRFEPERVIAELRARSATLGSRVRVELPGAASVIGLASDLTADGQLVVVDDDGGRHTIGTGDVVHVRAG